MYFGDILVLAVREPPICNVPDWPCQRRAVFFVAHYCTPASRSPELQVYSFRSAEFQAYALGRTPPDKTCPALTVPQKGCAGFKMGAEKKAVLPL